MARKPAQTTTTTTIAAEPTPEPTTTIAAEPTPEPTTTPEPKPAEKPKTTPEPTQAEESDDAQQANLVGALHAATQEAHGETGTLPDASKDAVYRAYRAARKGPQSLALMQWQAETFAPDYNATRDQIGAVFSFMQSVISGDWKPGKVVPESTPTHVILAWQLALLEQARAELVKRASVEAADPDLIKLAQAVMAEQGFNVPDAMTSKLPKVLGALEVRTSTADTVGHILDLLRANPDQVFTLAEMRRATLALGSRGAGTVDNRMRDLGEVPADGPDETSSRSTRRLWEAGARIITNASGARVWALIAD